MQDKNGGFMVGVNKVMSFVLERFISLLHVGCVGWGQWCSAITEF